MLQKLVFMFEVKESLATSVIEVICDSNLANHGEQVVAVEKWLNQHTDIQLNHEEISQLIYMLSFTKIILVLTMLI